MLLVDFQDWSYVYRPPSMWKVANSNKYAPLPILPSQTMTTLYLPAPYRPSVTMNPSPVNPSNPSGMETASTSGRSLLPTLIRPFNRIPMAPPVPHFPRGVPPAPFSPISSSPYLEGPHQSIFFFFFFFLVVCSLVFQFISLMFISSFQLIS